MKGKIYEITGANATEINPIPFDQNLLSILDRWVALLSFGLYGWEAPLSFG